MKKAMHKRLEAMEREWQAADYITKCTIERHEWHRRRKEIFIAILCLPLYATMIMLGRAFADFMMR